MPTVFPDDTTPRIRDWRDLLIQTYSETTANLEQQIVVLTHDNIRLRAHVAHCQEIVRASCDVLRQTAQGRARKGAS